MLTPIVLALVADHQPIGIAAVAEALRSTTGWNVTERGLYRTLHRLEDSQLLATSQVDAPRTGAKRKEHSLTDLGVAFLAGIRANLVEVPDDGWPIDACPPPTSKLIRRRGQSSAESSHSLRALNPSSASMMRETTRLAPSRGRTIP